MTHSLIKNIKSKNENEIEILMIISFGFDFGACMRPCVFRFHFNYYLLTDLNNITFSVLSLAIPWMRWRHRCGQINIQRCNRKRAKFKRFLCKQCPEEKCNHFSLLIPIKSLAYNNNKYKHEQKVVVVIIIINNNRSSSSLLLSCVCDTNYTDYK